MYQRRYSRYQRPMNRGYARRRSPYGYSQARRPVYGARAGFNRRGPMRRRFTVGGSRW